MEYEDIRDGLIGFGMAVASLFALPELVNNLVEPNPTPTVIASPTVQPQQSSP